jgi:spore coat protein CotH
MRTSLLILACTMFSLVASADPALDVMFDRSRLHDVRISMSAADWTKLRATYQENTNYDATITIDGETIGNSTIRSRGSATRNPIKPGLRVDFNRKIKTQTLHGLKILVLDNMYNDYSFLREQLAFSVFEQAGIVVPRESFARLTVNGQYWGLYAIVEAVDKVFVTSHIDGGDGNLFEYNVPAGIPGQTLAWDFSLSRGGAVENYVPSPFEPKTNEDHLDGTALLAFIRTISEATDATFVDDISAFIDPRQFLTHYAIEVATAEIDGLGSFFGTNNFYLYQLQGAQRFVFIPWDHDFNFTAANQPIYFGADRNRLIGRLLASPELAAFYRDTLQSILGNYVNAGWMNPRIEFFLSLIRPSVLEDTKRRGGDDPSTSTQKFDDEVEHVRNVIGERGTSVDIQMHPTRHRATRH